jgi:hypothetical protein
MTKLAAMQMADKKVWVISLDAIDAPESRQTCLDAAETPYRCGQRLVFALADMREWGVASCPESALLR